MDASTRCTSNLSCSSSLENTICDLTSGQCVQCTLDQASACTGETPICSANTCRGCSTHSECLSQACLPTGACGSASQVAYVDAQGSQNFSCSLSQPCSTIAGALSTGRPYIKVHGHLIDELVTFLDAHVTVLADPGAVLESVTAIGPIVTVSGASDVSIYDLTIQGAIGTNNGWGVIVRQATGIQPSLNLERVTVRNSRREGIISEDLTNLRISRSLILGNALGGAHVYGNSDITNSLFVVNGSPTSIVGGVWLDPIHVGTTIFSFNTIADNITETSATDVNGINCTTPLATTSNIVSNNKAAANCSPDYSLLDVGAGPAAHNKFGNPLFKNRGYTAVLPPDFYRISDISPAIDCADPTSTVMSDIDGDARPKGNAPDIGADELN